MHARQRSRPKCSISIPFGAGCRQFVCVHFAEVFCLFEKWLSIVLLSDDEQPNNNNIRTMGPSAAGALSIGNLLICIQKHRAHRSCQRKQQQHHHHHGKGTINAIGLGSTLFAQPTGRANGPNGSVINHSVHCVINTASANIPLYMSRPIWPSWWWSELVAH